MLFCYILKRLLSLPRTIWFNFRYLPFKEAIHLPIWIANNVRIRNLYKGGIKFQGNVSLGIVRIGYHCADAVDTYSVHTIIDIQKMGKLILKGDAHIGHGAVICVKQQGTLTIGKNFAISGTTRLICTRNILIGNDVQFSWDTLVMDSDAHKIWDKNNIKFNNCESIIIGNKVWIAANCTLLKGTVIQDNCVIASNSLLNKTYLYSNRIIGGIPAREIKEIGGWEL
jgi:carbonic anhydrase/acetyltransferase-like protein (isoleucine patch superfamily)